MSTSHLGVVVVAISLNLLSLVFLLSFAHAENKKPFQTGQLMTITYGSISWNNSREVDSAFLLIREKGTGKIVTIQLEETEPDSSQFKGKFSLNFSGDTTIAPEVYIPPAQLRGESDLKKLYGMIQRGELLRKPVIARKTDKGPVLDVYDTREQAERALKAYQEEQRLAKQRLLKPLPSQQVLSAAKLAQMNSLAMEAAKRESERVRLEQLERQRILEKERQSKKLSQAQKEANQLRATQLGQEALKHYQTAEFAQAEEKFKQSSELDPENQSYFFKYGISLYRNNKFNEALIMLKISKEDSTNVVEKKYYMALIHLRLKEYNQSMPLLDEVAAAKDPVLGPSALFYKGVVLFEMEKFEEAKKPFEDVIDTSSDPKLDQAAEDYLDRISSAIQTKALRSKKFTVTGTVGAMYDSNVTLTQNNDAFNSTSTDASDLKLMTSGDLEWRALFTDQHEASAIAAVSLTQATKTKLAYTDPWTYSVAGNYSYKGILWKKGYKLTLRPGYEVLNMGEGEGDTSKKNIQNSYFLSADNTFVMRKDYFAMYGAEIRKDNSELATSIGPADGTATKMTLKTAHSFFFDVARKEALIASGTYTLNSAKGDDKKYKRLEVGALYVRPVWQDTSWNIGINWYKINYHSSSDSRRDQNLGISSGLSRAWTDKWTLSTVGSYNTNASNVALNEYNKLLIMGFATYRTNF